jgi:hypothetical protein
MPNYGNLARDRHDRCKLYRCQGHRNAEIYTYMKVSDNKCIFIHGSYMLRLHFLPALAAAHGIRASNTCACLISTMQTDGNCRYSDEYHQHSIISHGATTHL